MTKIDRDKTRFREIVKGKVRRNLRDYISHGEMIGRKGKDLVSIPLPSLIIEVHIEVANVDDCGVLVSSPLAHADRLLISQLFFPPREVVGHHDEFL